MVDLGYWLSDGYIIEGVEEPPKHSASEGSET